ncbi:response regulator transcription factor [Guggenheimella bovis]
MKKILIIEDQASIVELIQYNLEMENYEVDSASDGEMGLRMLKSKEYDLLLLDLMLPKIDGIALTNILRKQPEFKKLPIIMLTAKSTELDKVLGLEIGADDYMTKPFSIRELIARVKAMLRRTEGDEVAEKKIIEVNGIVINDEEFTVTKDGELIELTLKEFLLLKFLAENRGKVLTRSFLLDKIWGYEYVGETRTVDVHIRHLRAKLADDEDLIKTVRGIGYKMI